MRYKNLQNFEIIKLNSSNYNLSNNVWNMESCEYTEQFTQQVAYGTREPYLMKYKKKYVASCDLVYDYGEYTDKNKVYLSRLIVKKEYRNNGIGQELLKYMIAVCKKKGYQQITVGVDTDNENALHIYKKFGFEIYETAIDKYGEYYKMICSIG